MCVFRCGQLPFAFEKTQWLWRRSGKQLSKKVLKISTQSGKSWPKERETVSSHK